MIPIFERDITLFVFGKFDKYCKSADFTRFTDYNPPDMIYKILEYYQFTHITVSINSSTTVPSGESLRMKLFQKLVKADSKHLFDGGRCTLDSNV